MAVISCKAIGDGRAGPIRADGTRRYTRRFRVITDDVNDGPIVVRQAVGLPALGSPYSTGTESDSLAVAVGIDPQQTNDECVWIVTVEYDSAASVSASRGDAGGAGSGSPGQGAQSPENRPENPLDRPTVWTRQAVKVRKAVNKDLNNVPVMNSAGLYFDPPYEVERVLGQWTAVRNYASFTEADCQEFEGRYNDAAYKGFPEASVKVDSISLSGMYENGTSFVQVTWVFLYDPDLWQPVQILDRGPFFYVGEDKVPFQDDERNGHIGLLDGSGGEGDPDAPTFLDFKFHHAFNATDARLP